VGENDPVPQQQPQPPSSLGARTDRPFVWKVQGTNSGYQRTGVEVIASSEFEAKQKARQQWNLNTSGQSEEEYFRNNGWVATPIRPAPPRPIPGVTDIEPDIPMAGSTQDLQRHMATPGAFTGAWKIVDTDTGQELYRFSGIGNSQADANRVAADWLRQNAPEDSDMTQIEVVPIMR